MTYCKFNCFFSTKLTVRFSGGTILLIPIGLVVGFNLYKNGVKESNDEYFSNGGSQAVNMMGNSDSDSIILDNLSIKYPNKYKITEKYGSEKSLGGYTFMCDYPQDELTFSYSSKQNSPIKSVDEKMNNLEAELLPNINQISKSPAKLQNIKTERIGNFEVRVRKIDYNNNSLYIYGLETENYYFVFTSHLKYFLDAIVRNLTARN